MKLSVRLYALCAVCAVGEAVSEPAAFASSPPVYPSPNTNGIGWEAALSKARAFASNLTLDEKVSIVTGIGGPCVGNIQPISRLAFRGLCLQDGPTALRLATLVDLFPSGVTVAASWDRQLARLRGSQLGAEFRDKGSHVAFGPVVGPLGRQSMGGRNWEGFSPDPFLTGAMVEQTVQGMQGAGVQATTKHFIGNEQETQRNPTPQLLGPQIEAYSSNIDDRTMHELYMWPFANAVHAGTSSVMCSYNRLNSSYACQNSKVLNGLLKTELGFQGYVVSDFGAVHAGVATILSGLDMNQPGGTTGGTNRPSLWDQKLVEAVNNGSVPASRLDDMVVRVMTPYYQLGQDQGYPTVDGSTAAGNPLTLNPSVAASLVGPPFNRDVRGDHGQLVRELGAAGVVLLKNNNHALPLTKPKSIAVFGDDQGTPTQALINSQGLYTYGALPVGGGSGTGHASYIVTPSAALEMQASVDGTVLRNYSMSVPLGFQPPDVCLVFLRSFAQEAQDRSSLLPDSNGADTVSRVAAACKNTVVVTHAPGANILPFAAHPNVTAILAAHYPGQEIGNSIVDVLYGRTNPSGKLPYTIANSANDYNTHILNIGSTTDPNAWQDNYTERLLIDYRYFDVGNKSVLYDFGHGLSYTKFALSDIKASQQGTMTPLAPAAQTAPGGNPHLWDVLSTVTATVTNTGNVTGAAVPQLYLDLGAGAPPGTPARQLRGFDKVSLTPGESKTVSFPLMRRDMSFWDTVTQQWTVPKGQMTAHVGFSSRDLKGSAALAGA